MANVTLTNKCTCPKCAGSGMSVAAMNMKETHVWDKDGHFSGSGVGVGTFGVGIGMGGGTYNERGESRSKRAEIMEAPQHIRLPYISLIVGGLFASFVLYSAPSFLPSFASATNGGAVSSSSLAIALTPALLKIVAFIAAPAALVTLVCVWLNAEKNRSLEEKINATEYPQQLARYNALRYCENCNVLYDSNGNSKMANQVGFAAMMQIE